MNTYTKYIAQTLNLSEKIVAATLNLLDEGCTIPFIARYRKERTGNLDELQITHIAEMNERLAETDKRKGTILKTIGEQGKLTKELESRIVNCWDNAVLEDLYLPFKPKRRTKAQIAREQGLEPLATLLLMQREQNPTAASKRFVKGNYCRNGKRKSAGTQHSAKCLQTRSRDFFEGDKESRRHGRGTEVFRLLQFLRAIATLQQPSAIGYEARRSRRNIACRHFD